MTTIERHILYEQFLQPYRSVYHEDMSRLLIITVFLIPIVIILVIGLTHFSSYTSTRVSMIPTIHVGTKITVNSSAYAPSKYQTDATPCITASGTTVRPGVVATNFLPLGTIISIQGEKYIVEDRMNARYRGYYLDIWFPSTAEALDFGRKKIDIVIEGYGKPGDAIRKEPLPATDTNTIQPKQTFWQSVIATSNDIGQLLMTKVNPNKYDVSCAP